MRHLELHMLQSVPVACLNRDDLGSPKTAFFGGVQRARVSSQCWKRAVRELAKELRESRFKGFRSKNTTKRLLVFLEEEGLPEKEAILGANYLFTALHSSKADENNEDSESSNESSTEIDENDALEDSTKKSVLFFTTDVELRCFAKHYIMTGQNEILKPKQNKKGEIRQPKKENIVKAIKRVTQEALKELGNKHLSNGEDIALFGRMTASLPHLNIEGASMFSHALSTHKVDNEIDFFSALDETQSEDKSGAGMIGTLEFNAATYYRFAALNLDMLADDAHLGSLTREERQDVVATFVEATLKAMPGARKNSMNAHTLPSHVMCVLRDTGHPIQLVNAFEQAVWSPQGKGYMQASFDAMKKEYAELENTWGLKAASCLTIPEKSLNDLLQGVRAHVR